MNIRWIGALLILVGCGGWGISLASGYRRQERLLRKLDGILKQMQWELKYRLTALPDLCRMAAKDTSGELRSLFQDLAGELEAMTQPNVAACMYSVLKRHETLPPKVRRILRHLGKILGRYDLEGQLQGMQSILGECGHERENLEKDRDNRIKNYQTLGICSGVALVILFL